MVAGGALALLAVSVGTTDALGSAPSWKLAATVRDAEFDDVTVTGAKDAWAVGSVPVNSGRVPRVAHWDGRSWKTVVLPAAAKSGNLSSVSASSSTNVWAGGIDVTGRPYFLHWDGRRWQVSVGKGSANGPVVLTLGKSDTWTFTWKNGTSVSEARHFNGRRWSSINVPGVVSSVSALSGRDIWAAGLKNATTNLAPSILHWNGKAWSQVRSPAVPAFRTDFSGILARKDTDVWMVGQSLAPPQTSLPLAYHWNGKSWQDLAPPASAGPLYSATDDGAGGIWAIGSQNRLYHYRAGKWTSAQIPSTPGYYSGIDKLARIPSTTSLWGVGWLTNRTIWNGLVFKYAA